MFTLLFNLLEEGPFHYHQPLLQIIHHLLSVTIETISDSSVFKSKIPQWFGLVSRFLNGGLWSDAMQVLNIAVKQPDLTYSPLLTLTLSDSICSTQQQLELAQNVPVTSRSSRKEISFHFIHFTLHLLHKSCFLLTHVTFPIDRKQQAQYKQHNL